MRKKLPIFYSALMLTGVNLLLRLVSTSFQVFISGRIGAAGVGLLQLVLSVASMTLTAGIAGIRTAVEEERPPVLVNKTKGVEIPLATVFTDRQKKMILAGGLLNATKNG